MGLMSSGPKLKFVKFASRSIVVSIVRNVIRIVRYISYRVQKFSYSKCSWIVQYRSINRIVSVNRTYRTIHRHVGLKLVFLLKFVVLFNLNKLLDFFNTKLLGNLIESNSHEFFFSSLLFLLQNLDYTHNTHFHICKYIFYAINNKMKI